MALGLLLAPAVASAQSSMGATSTYEQRGFVQVDPDWLPEARKRKYNWDRKSLVFVKKLA